MFLIHEREEKGLSRELGRRELEPEMKKPSKDAHLRVSHSSWGSMHFSHRFGIIVNW
jgi:hypothetical protein